MSVEECDDQLKTLRDVYVRGFPSQRVDIARQRVDEASHGAGIGLLIAYVSAIEGILRSLVIWNEKEPSSDRPTSDTYKKYKNTKTNDLYEKYCEQYGEKPDKVIPDETKDLVWCAVEYRHLLVHECTFLNAKTSTKLNEACEIFLQKLCEHAGQRYVKCDWSQPDKPYSGKFLVRVDPALHRKLVTDATSERMSLNEWVVETLEKRVGA